MIGLRLVGVPETNKVMAGELSRIARRAVPGARVPEPRKEGTGQLVYPFDPELAWTAVTYHRTCARVMWDLYETDAGRLEPMYDDLVAQVRADARAWCDSGARFSVYTSNVAELPAGERQIVGMVKNALIDGCAGRGVTLAVDPDEPDLVIAARAHGDKLRVSIDLAGGPMHVRGYRAGLGGDAPLRENLAAVLVMLARHQGHREPLVDPMAGSGTIAIEAALLARGEPVRRDAAAVRARLAAIPALAPQAARAAAAPSAPCLFGDTQPEIVASDVDPDAVARARAAAEAAGVSAWVRVTEADFERAPMPRHPGVIVCNPPYGERLGGDEVVALYGRFGAWLRRQRGWRALVFVGNREWEAAVGLRPRLKKPLTNGPIRGYVYGYEL